MTSALYSNVALSVMSFVLGLGGAEEGEQEVKTDRFGT